MGDVRCGIRSDRCHLINRPGLSILPLRGPGAITDIDASTRFDESCSVAINKDRRADQPVEGRPSGCTAQRPRYSPPSSIRILSTFDVTKADARAEAQRFVKLSRTEPA